MEIPKIPIIPPMTNSLGKYWEQPAREKISLSLSHAHMTQKSMDELKDYSCSVPTGIYAGKMWKSFGYGRWYLRFIGTPEPGSDPNIFVIHTLRIGIEP